MSLGPGVRLGPYEIQSAIGAGGMGEVYRARDTRLDRTVAIKVLPSQVSSDPALRERFEREARTVAALNHPHICTLHDVGRDAGTDFLVMEYLDGETLAQRLAKGAISLDQALSIAVQIADALDKAHRAGIVHRDLKPGNIMLVRRGGPSGPPDAKLLDFGLAKVTPAAVAASGLSVAPTLQTPVTMQGTILGTLQYMAPEQIEGQEADARTDIFAFGCVLYEMVTGKKAFEGKTQASLIGAILKDIPPPISTLQPIAPPMVDHIVTRCLAKDPDERWQSATDLGKELEWVARGGAADGIGPLASARGTRQPRVAWTIAACAALVAVGALGVALWMWTRSGEANAARITRLAFPRPAGTSLTNTGRPIIAISPDGENIVFVADYQLYVRNLARDEAQPIAGTALGQVYQPFFSPDGQWVGLIDVDASTIKKVPLAGGAALSIGPAGPATGYGASWSDDNRIVFANGDGIFRVAADRGTPEKIIGLKIGEVALRPQLLPDGDHLLFTLATGFAPDRWDTASIVTESLSTHQRDVILTGGADARYVGTGYLVYALGKDLMAVAFDAATRHVSGAPRIVERGILRANAANTGAAQFVTSARGDLAYIPDAPATDLLTFIEPKTGFPFGVQPFSGGQWPRVSPDGKRLAVGENGDIWVYPLGNSAAPRRVTTGGIAGFEVWTPDGSRIAFGGLTESGWEIQWQNADGDGRAERIVGVGNDPGGPIGWSTNPATFFFATSQRAFSGTIQSLRPGQPAHKLWDALWGGSLSPDGQWLAFYRVEGNRNIVFIGSVNDPSNRYQVSKEGGHHPIWSRDGKRIYYAANSTGPSTSVMSVDVQMEPSVSFGQPSVLVDQILQPLNQDRQYDIMPDGRVIAAVLDPRRSTRSGEIVVVQHWQEELKRLVSTR